MSAGDQTTEIMTATVRTELLDSSSADPVVSSEPIGGGKQSGRERRLLAAISRGSPGDFPI